jgi:hypothetical protein
MRRDESRRPYSVHRAIVRPDPSQEATSRYSRKKDHDNPREAHAFHGFKGAMRIESLNRDIHPLNRRGMYTYLLVCFLGLT